MRTSELGVKRQTNWNGFFSQLSVAVDTISLTFLANPLWERRYGPEGTSTTSLPSDTWANTRGCFPFKPCKLNNAILYCFTLCAATFALNIVCCLPPCWRLLSRQIWTARKPLFTFAVQSWMKGTSQNFCRFFRLFCDCNYGRWFVFTLSDPCSCLFWNDGLPHRTGYRVHGMLKLCCCFLDCAECQTHAELEQKLICFCVCETKLARNSEEKETCHCDLVQGR